MSKKIKIGKKLNRLKINLFKIDKEISSCKNECSLPHLAFSGNSELQIEGCKSIIEYGEEKIQLNLGKGTVVLIGKNMSITSLSSNEMLILGKILTVEFTDLV